MGWTSPKPFQTAALLAFPFAWRPLAAEAASVLTPWVDDSYRKRSTAIERRGEHIYIPNRFHFSGFEANPADLPIAARLLLTRATDGYLRHRALKASLPAEPSVAAPFFALLAADYVVEIAEEISRAASTLDRPAYAEFVRENRALMRVLRERAVSYWDFHYRTDYPDRSTYPGLVVLHQFEAWAA